MVPVLELTIDQLEAKLAANVVAQFVLIKVGPSRHARAGPGHDRGRTPRTSPPPTLRVLSARADGGSATPPPRPPSTVSRPLLAVELGERAIRAFNLDPGYVETERQQRNAAALGLVGHYRGAPPSVPAAAIAWLADHPEEVENGQTVLAQKLALTRQLHPDWRTPS